MGGRVPVVVAIAVRWVMVCDSIVDYYSKEVDWDYVVCSDLGRIEACKGQHRTASRGRSGTHRDALTAMFELEE